MMQYRANDLKYNQVRSSISTSADMGYRCPMNPVVINRKYHPSRREQAHDPFLLPSNT